METRVCKRTYRDGEVAGEIAVGGIPGGNVVEEIGIGGGGCGGGGVKRGRRTLGGVGRERVIEGGIIIGEVEEVLHDELVGGSSGGVVNVGGGGGVGGELWREKLFVCLHGSNWVV